ncbi:MAG: hypothetical protein LBE31_02390 [Deltaproteobacteria bacterium]|jgi:hypothetical protein|nr:hypothetical protein [Deltaproteobacteria bacterium]
MNTWLPLVVKELSENREPILALAERSHVARAAVLDDRGLVLNGELGSDDVENAVSTQAMTLKTGQASSMVIGDTRVITEKLGGQRALAFWREAALGQSESWAAWLLTITKPGEAGLSVVRHVLAANGPFTTPRLPKEEDWSLLPLNAGLGRLFVFGDDEVALETAALGARVGLKVTMVTVHPLELDLRSAQTIGHFELLDLQSWSIAKEKLIEMGIKPGVLVLITTTSHSTFLPFIKESGAGWLGLAGQASESQPEQSGLFPKAVSPSQRALELIASMLERRQI